MFTPPPSPNPPQQKQIPMPTLDVQKQRTGRRFRCAVLLVPLVLVFITLSTRYLTHPAAFDIISQASSSGWEDVWKLHRRHPQNSPTNTPTSPQPIPTVPSVPPTLPTPFPQAYDPQLTLNFSSVSCLSFFTNMTQSTAFRRCRPFSLLTQTSETFINAQTNLTDMNTLIWGTCNTNVGVNQCIANMGWFTSELETACSDDLRDRNALAVDTLTALSAYEVMYDAACLADPTTNTYCYINAVANSNPIDLYFYQLPLGTNLPKTSKQMTCSPCTRSVLGIYAQALQENQSGNELAGLKETYEGAAKLAIDSCGSDYAKLGVANAAVGNRLMGVGAGVGFIKVYWFIGFGLGFWMIGF